MAANYLLVSVIYNKSGFPPAPARPAGGPSGRKAQRPNPHTHYEARVTNEWNYMD